MAMSNAEPATENMVGQGMVEPTKAEEATPTLKREVPLSPVPMSWNISQKKYGDEFVIAISIQTAEGDKFYYLKPHVGKQLGEAILQLSNAVLDIGVVVEE